MQALAEATGLAMSTLYGYENGSRSPRRSAAKQIEAATNGEVTAAELLGLTDISSSGVRNVREDAAPFKGQTQVSVNVPENLLNLAREQGLDVQGLLGKGGVPALRQAAKEAWYEANKDAIESSRRYVEKYGTFSEQMGML